MSINYYCSGFDINDAFWPELASRFKSEIKHTKSIVYIPGSPDNLEKTLNKYIPSFTEHFKKIGIEFENVYLITSNMDRDVAKNLIRNASFIMLMGGDPYKQKELCERLGLVEELKSYDGIILGYSAGAMLMSKNIIIVPCSVEYPTFHIESGMGLSNISIYPHNNFNGEEFPESIINGEEITKSEDLIRVARKYGKFYLLQDNYISEGITEVSLIRTFKDSVEFITHNNGRIWMVTNDGIELCKDKLIEE